MSKVRKIEKVASQTTCEKCHAVLEVGAWPWCPHGRPNYAWHFAQGQNDARRESFYQKRAADPFGDVSA